ncbi:unnamed protein product [Allacma fusca]|uniref:Uncharacterized protein n=1 Tax=Allacma fusca TaxID=39272 RepID=A0A8J2LNW4_9HEXA|nr:unnamed protein product [Allacma fusca]
MSFVTKILVLVILVTLTNANERVKRGGFTGHGGYGAAGGLAYSSDLLIGSNVGGNLAYDSAQRNFFSLNAGDLGNSFDVGDSANAIAKATRTSAAAGSKFKGGYGK